MFEGLFIVRGAIARYRGAPLLRERLSYLRHCSREGARPLTLRRIAATQLTLVRFLDLRGGERVSVPRVEATADHRSSRSAQPMERQAFVSRAVRWLRFADLLRSSGSGCAESADGPSRRSAAAAARRIQVRRFRRDSTGTRRDACSQRPKATGRSTCVTGPSSWCRSRTGCVPVRAPGCGLMIRTGKRRRYGYAAPNRDARSTIRSLAVSDRPSFVTSSRLVRCAGRGRRSSRWSLRSIL